MSDHNTPPDPIDKAYVQAETSLGDDASRAARRARVLAAVAQESGPAKASPGLLRWRPAWRRDGWLAAACVVGLGLFLTTRFYAPDLNPQVIPRAPAAAAPKRADQGPAVAPPPHALVPSTTPRAAPVAPRVNAPPARVSLPVAMAAPPPPQVQPRAAPAAGPEVQEVVVTGSRIHRNEYNSASPVTVLDGKAEDRATAPIGVGGVEPAPAAAPAPPPPPPPLAYANAPAALAGAMDLTASLDAAAADGRTGEVEALLARGAPVDVPDDEGDTALMRSVRADKPAVAALLRRHGASLDRKNHAGENAKDMAAAVGDPKLDRALGLARKK